MIDIDGVVSRGYAIASTRIAVHTIEPNGEQEADTIRLDDFSLAPRDVISKIVLDCQRRRPTPDTVCLSFGGHVDHVARNVVYVPDAVRDPSAWVEPIVKSMTSEIGVPMSVENDANCMAYYYWRNHPDPVPSSLAVVYLWPYDGGGLGAGIILNGRLFRGHDGAAGELGHLSVQPTGARCRCDARGCLEAMLSEENLLREMNWGGRRSVHSLTEAVESLPEDEEISRVLEQAGKYLGQGLAAMINLFNPEEVAIGGADVLLNPQSRSNEMFPFKAGFDYGLHHHLFNSISSKYSKRIVKCELGLNKAAAGAAFLAADELKSGIDMSNGNSCH